MACFTSLSCISSVLSHYCVVTGHNSVLHACTVEDEAFVGMGSTILDGAVVEKGAMVAAGSVVTQKTRIPTGQVIVITLRHWLVATVFFLEFCYHNWHSRYWRMHFSTDLGRESGEVFEGAYRGGASFLDRKCQRLHGIGGASRAGECQDFWRAWSWQGFEEEMGHSVWWLRFTSGHCSFQEARNWVPQQNDLQGSSLSFHCVLFPSIFGDFLFRVGVSSVVVNKPQWLYFPPSSFV